MSRGRPRGTGKPIKPAAETLPESVTVRLGTDQYDSLCREALHRGVSIGAVIRARLFSVTTNKSVLANGPTIGGE